MTSSRRKFGGPSNKFGFGITLFLAITKVYFKFGSVSSDYEAETLPSIEQYRNNLYLLYWNPIGSIKGIEVSFE
jgi:hypothetical protein